MKDESSKISDEYDRRAYQQIVRTISGKPGWIGRTGERVGGLIGSAGRRMVSRVPSRVADMGEGALRSALAGLRAITIDPAFRSVTRTRVVKAYVTAGAQFAELDELRHLPLRTIDGVMPSLRWKCAAGAAVEGAGAGAIVTGAELVASVGSVASAGASAAPGAGAVVGAMAADAAAVLAASARVVAHIGA